MRAQKFKQEKGLSLIVPTTTAAMSKLSPKRPMSPAQMANTGNINSTGSI